MNVVLTSFSAICKANVLKEFPAPKDFFRKQFSVVRHAIISLNGRMDSQLSVERSEQNFNQKFLVAMCCLY
jgi:hypothetical protein